MKIGRANRWMGSSFSLFFLLSEVIDMNGLKSNDHHSSVVSCSAIIMSEEMMRCTTTKRSVYPLPLIFSLFFFSFEFFPSGPQLRGSTFAFPPNRGVWLVALDLVTVFRLGGAHFQGNLIRSRARTGPFGVWLYQRKDHHPPYCTIRYPLLTLIHRRSSPRSISEFIPSAQHSIVRL